jgi:hypothetical protein
MYGVARLLPHNFLECIVLQQLELAGLARQSQRPALIPLLVGVLAERASKKCISRQGRQSFARLGPVARLSLPLLVLRRTETQVEIQQLLLVLRH